MTPRHCLDKIFIRGKMTTDQISTLLYLETCVVDNAGKVTTLRLNDQDIEIINTWVEEGFITFARLKLDHVTSTATHAVTFSEKAWEESHKYRKARGLRMLKNKSWEVVNDQI